MSTYGFSTAGAIGNNLPSGIASVITDIGAGYSQTLSDLSDTKFTQTHMMGKDQYGRERVHGILAEASWRFHLMDGTNIPLLATWANTNGFHKTALNLINGDVVVFGNATVGHNGVPKWRLVIDGGPDADRYVEMSLKRKAVVASGVAAVLDNDIIWSTFTSDALTTLFTGGVFRSASGVKTFSLRNTGESNWEEVGPIKNTSFVAELQCDEDEQGRYIPRNTVLITYGIDVMDVSPTSLAVLDTLHQVASNDCKFVLMDNATITCADNLGCVADVIEDGDVEKGAVLHFHGSGEMLLSSFAGLFS